MCVNYTYVLPSLAKKELDRDFSDLNQNTSQSLCRGVRVLVRLHRLIEAD